MKNEYELPVVLPARPRDTIARDASKIAMRRARPQRFSAAPAIDNAHTRAIKIATVGKRAAGRSKVSAHLERNAMNASGGQSNVGSSKYGGSDYASNDYRHNESQFGGPYDELSARQQLAEGDFGNTGREGEYPFAQPGAQVVDTAWSRARSSGEWRANSLATSSATSYCGKGPKGYTRSDERLKELVCEMLTDAPHIDAGDIDIEVKNGEVTLTGSVPDRYSKHAVEDLIEQHAGVSEIHNRLKVNAAAHAPGAAVRGTKHSEGASAGQTARR